MSVSNFSQTSFMGRRGSWDITKYKRSPKGLWYGYIIGHDCDLFLGHCFNAMYFVYPFTSHNKFNHRLTVRLWLNHRLTVRLWLKSYDLSHKSLIIFMWPLVPSCGGLCILIDTATIQLAGIFSFMTLATSFPFVTLATFSFRDACDLFLSRRWLGVALHFQPHKTVSV